MNRFQIAELLVTLRGKRSREEVANALNLSKRAIEAYEIGYRVPTDEIKIRIAKLYGVSVGYLFFGEE